MPGRCIISFLPCVAGRNAALYKSEYCNQSKRYCGVADQLDIGVGAREFRFTDQSARFPPLPHHYIRFLCDACNGAGLTLGVGTLEVIVCCERACVSRSQRLSASWPTSQAAPPRSHQDAFSKPFPRIYGMTGLLVREPATIVAIFLLLLRSDVMFLSV